MNSEEYTEAYQLIYWTIKIKVQRNKIPSIEY